MTRIAYTPPQPVVPERRKYLSESQKIARWNALGRCCTVCHEPCAPYGPTVIWDHRIQLAHGGGQAIEAFECHHAEVCAALKTAADAKSRAKANRIRKREAGEKRPGRKIAGRGFDRSKTRGFDGTVRDR